ncbi:MAG: DUF4159 domain-containing protein [Xanthomonadales bacterium]|nr:DUF4159 domain-containing protein [Xanthomonadales bacterium]
MIRKITPPILIGAGTLVLALWAGLVTAQWDDGGSSDELDQPSAEFSFARVMYYSTGRQGYGRSWRTDWPDAEYHFSRGIERLTRIDVDTDGKVLRLTDDALFDYPWIYAVEVGSWTLTNAEILRLREYLNRGGFLMVDDFHGTEEWAGFIYFMRQVFPNRPIVELEDSHEVLHVLYDLDQRIQIPGRHIVGSGRTWERDGITPHWRGIYDDQGRLMVAINFNMDMGDAWEHADDPWYPEPMTGLAYRFGINYIIYAMTH